MLQVVENIAFLDYHGSLRDTLKEVSDSPSPNAFAILKVAHKVARLCNAAKFDAATIDRPLEERTVKGDPTDTSLLRFSEGLSIPALGINTADLLSSWNRHFEIPFNSRNKWSLTVITEKQSLSQGPWVLVKGAPDVLFPHCQTALRGDGTSVPLGDRERQQFSALQDQWSSEGQRVLAL